MRHALLVSSSNCKGEHLFKLKTEFFIKEVIESDGVCIAMIMAPDSADIAISFDDLEEEAVDPKGVDNLIAKELTGLSVVDREKVFFDLHGVSGEENETPAMIEASLQLLQKELDVVEVCHGYKKALAMDPTYVQNQTFLLKFLRADRFDPHAAAKRLTKFFDYKLDLFGEDLIVKDITQADLDDQDLDSLYNGMGMDLPFRDPAGRLVFFQLARSVNVPVRALLRKTLYGCMIYSNDEETQRKGAVSVSYLVGQKFNWHEARQRQDMNKQLAAFTSCLPLRFEALHVCIDSIIWRPILAVYKIYANIFTRVRVREHIGDHEQVLFSLQTFGIPTHGFPVTKDGQILRHLCAEQWSKRRRLEEIMRQKAEAEQKLSDGTARAPVVKVQPIRVGTPGQNDVLFGRGRAYYSHIGNLRLRNIIIERSPAYERAGPWEKKMVSFEIVKRIKKKSGRFLKEDDAGWVEVDDETATKKVSHCFRTLRGLKNANSTETSHSGKRKNQGDH